MNSAYCDECGENLLHGHEPGCSEGPAPQRECDKCGAPCNGTRCIGCQSHQE